MLCNLRTFRIDSSSQLHYLVEHLSGLERLPMNEPQQGREVLQIKKYPNRRYYDATRSCHVTLHDVHDLILDGKDVVITDSRTNEDITNLVLTQILLEKDQPKLDIFPASILHMMIRSNRQVLRGYVERFFAPMLNMVASSQRQFEQFMRSASGGTFMTPLDWANKMMEYFGTGGRSAGPGSADPVPDPEWDAADLGEPGQPFTRSVDSRPAGHPSDPESIEDLKAQASDLIRRIEELGKSKSEDGAGSE